MPSLAILAPSFKGLTTSTSAAFQPGYLRFRPYPFGYVFPLLYSVTAFASWMFLFPLGVCLSLTGRAADLPGTFPAYHGQTPSGFPRFTPLRCDGGWVLSLLRSLGVLVMGKSRTHNTAMEITGPWSGGPDSAVFITHCSSVLPNEASARVHFRSPVPSSPSPVCP
jgi:hypothetical protein